MTQKYIWGLGLSFLLVGCPGSDKDPDTGTDTGTDTDTEVDADGDGFNEDEDCDDSNSDINPDAVEICDEIDNNCDDLIDDDDPAVDTSAGGVFYSDGDSDGFGDDGSSIEACVAPSGYVDAAGDCDDSSKAVNPEATEDCSDKLDNDCDAVFDCDDDGCTGDTACAPTITGISPEWAVFGVDTDVTVTGSGFSWLTVGAVEVNVGTEACAKLTVVSDTELTCTASALSAGKVDVEISTDNGTAALKQGYSWFAPIYAADGRDVVGSLYTVDPRDGTVAEVGALKQGYTSLAFSPDNTLYGLSTLSSGTPSLYTIDPFTGAETLIAKLNSKTISYFAMPDASFVGSTLVAWTEDGDDPTTVDLKTGEVTVLGAGTSSYGTSLATDSKGIVWLIPQGAYGGIYTIDPKSGALTDTKVTPDDTKLTYNMDNWGGMTFFDGMLYQINAGYSGSKKSSYLVSVDPTTGLLSEIGVMMSSGVDAVASPMP